MSDRVPTALQQAACRRVQRGTSDAIGTLSCGGSCGNNGIVVLGYVYVVLTVSQAEMLVAQLQPLGHRLHLGGKIRISLEGVNMTAAGSKTDVMECCQQLESLLPKQGAIDWKPEPGCQHVFDGWSCRFVSEVVPLGVKNLQPHATKVEPQQWHQIALHAANDEGTIILDVRNWYESRIGFFDGAIRPPLRRFSNLPEWVKNNTQLFADKQVLTYCTGGVRCEKIESLLLQETGVRKVLQLDGGIVGYAHTIPAESSLFRGSNYVFDARGSVPITEDTVAACDGCGVATDLMVKCGHPRCHRILLACLDCRTSPVFCCGRCRTNVSPKRQPCDCDCDAARQRRLCPPKLATGTVDALGRDIHE